MLRSRFAYLPVVAVTGWLSACESDPQPDADTQSGGGSSPTTADTSTHASTTTSNASTSSGEGGGTAASGGGAGGSGGGGTCEDTCELEEVSCLEDAVITCVVGGEGCTIWSAGEICPAEAPYCEGGACSAVCNDACEPNDIRCSDDGAERCYATDTPDGPCLRWETPEPCDSNACLETGCEPGVGCTSEPVTCDDPPQSECLDADTLRVWDASGLCGQDGECNYAENDVPCANCPACDACEGVTCDTPPSACFEASGACQDGSCSYDFDDGADCDDADACTTGDDCASGVCAGTAVVCDDPNPPTCVDADTLRTFSGAGTCEAGTCEYTFVDETCDYGCEAGVCSDSPVVVCTPESTIIDAGPDVGNGINLGIADDNTVYIVYSAEAAVDMRVAVRAPTTGVWTSSIIDQTGFFWDKAPSLRIAAGEVSVFYESAYAYKPAGGSFVVNPSYSPIEHSRGSFGTDFLRKGHYAHSPPGSLGAAPAIGPWESFSSPDCMPVEGERRVRRDSLGGVHVVTRCGIGKGPFYAHKAPGGVFRTNLLDANGGDHIALAVDPSDTVHVLYGRVFDNRYHYATRASGASISAFTSTSLAPGSGPVALLIDSTGALRAYFHVVGSLVERVKVDAGWSVTRTIDTTGGGAFAVKTGPDGAIHVAYQDKTLGRVKYARYCPA